MITDQALIELTNEYFPEMGAYLDSCQRFSLCIYDTNILKSIIKNCKFKDIGNIFDFPELFGKPDNLKVTQLTQSFDLLERLAISKKFDAIVHYTWDNYCVRCTFLIATYKLKKFAKMVKDIINKDGTMNIFKDIDFKTEKGEFIEITKASDCERIVDVASHNVIDENLVFDPDSVINNVMHDINMFFREESFELYKKLDIPYRRGVILYGEPGNGKSAMIREIIRNTDNVCKIVISGGLHNITYILLTLLKALKGKKSIIVIEDIDSVINSQNRSEFLNIFDGVHIPLGVFFIGTTNYPDRIDPAFMNRSGRFDRTHEIKNPEESTRRLYFKSKDLGKIFDQYKVFKDDSKQVYDGAIVDIFVDNSKDLPMANLKELITSTCYSLVDNIDISVEEAVISCYNNILSTRANHIKSFESNLSNTVPPSRYFQHNNRF